MQAFSYKTRRNLGLTLVIAAIEAIVLQILVAITLKEIFPVWGYFVVTAMYISSGVKLYRYHIGYETRYQENHVFSLGVREDMRCGIGESVLLGILAPIAFFAFLIP